jgi:GTPase
MKRPIVAIVGRPNVGKSTLFNRFVSRRQAIVHNQPGVTRDRLYADVEWQHRHFVVIDTGGLVPDTKDSMEKIIKNQVQIAYEEADVILFLVDVRSGLDFEDKAVAQVLLKANKKVILVANKADNENLELAAAEFYALGLGEPLTVSAMESRNVGDLLDKIVALFPEAPQILEEDTDDLKLAIVGKPNVGKSSLVNALIGKERVLVDSKPGTTRDAIDTKFQYKGHTIIITDTAGMRRKRKINDSIEYYSTIRAISSIDRCDVAFVLLDATEGLTRQDQQILGEVTAAEKGCVILVNKWDLITKTDKTYEAYLKALRSKLGAWAFLPIEFISVLERQRIIEPLDLALTIKANRDKKIKTSELNEFVQSISRERSFFTETGKAIKFYYCTQAAIKPPTFILFTNCPQDISETQRRFIEKRMRVKFDFMGTPIRLWWRNKK